MRRWTTRRHLIGMAVGVIGTVVGSQRTRAGANVASCYWRKAGVDCYNGTTWERWCYRCCDASGCEDAYCEWRKVGTC